MRDCGQQSLAEAAPRRGGVVEEWGRNRAAALQTPQEEIG